MRAIACAVLLLTVVGCKKKAGPPMVVTVPLAEVVITLPGFEPSKEATRPAHALNGQAPLTPTAGGYEFQFSSTHRIFARHPQGVIAAVDQPMATEADCTTRAAATSARVVEGPTPRDVGGLSGQLSTTVQDVPGVGTLKSVEFAFRRDRCVRLELATEERIFDDNKPIIDAVIDGLRLMEPDSPE